MAFLYKNAKQMKDSNLRISSANLVKNLECPVCFETYTPPIYLCATGHTLCANCTKTIAKCPQCESLMTDKRCYTLESVLNDTFVDCKNGCLATVKYAQIDEHGEACVYRDVECNENGCVGTFISYSGYIAHLQTDHKCWDMSAFFMANGNGNADPRQNIKLDWLISPMKRGSEWFLFKMWTQNEDFCFYVVQFGNAKTSKSYECRVAIGNPYDAFKRQSFKIPRVDNFRVTEQNPNNYSVKTPKSQLMSLGQPLKDGKIQFYVKCDCRRSCQIL